MRIFILAGCLLLSNVCLAQNFRIRGDVSGVHQMLTKVYYRYAIGEKMIEDSVPVWDGKYVIEGTATDHTMIQTMASYQDKTIPPNYRNDYNVVHITPGTQATVTHLASFSKATVKGSAAQDEYQTLEDRLLSYDTAFIAKYVADHPASPLATFLVSEFLVGPIVNLAIHDHYFNLLSEENKQSAAGRKLQERLALAKLAQPGTAAPEITQKDATGKLVRLSHFRGKYVLVDFWASWCKPCRAENPELVKLYAKYKSQGLEILGISMDESREQWLKAIADDGLPWVHTSDLVSMEKNAAAQLFRLSGIPFSVLVDPEGKLLAYNLRGTALASKLQQVFGR